MEFEGVIDLRRHAVDSDLSSGSPGATSTGIRCATDLFARMAHRATAGTDGDLIFGFIARAVVGHPRRVVAAWIVVANGVLLASLVMAPMLVPGLSVLQRGTFWWPANKSKPTAPDANADSSLVKS